MPYEASRELRKNREFGDGNENNVEHLKNAEKTYLYIAKKYNWKYINCLKTKKYNSVDDIRSIESISSEIENVLDSELRNLKTNKIKIGYVETISSNEFKFPILMDLCPNCVREFEEWVNKYKENEEEGEENASSEM